MNIEYCGVCDKGLKREMNQDAIFMRVDGKSALFAVADGMGGHSDGEKASGEVIKQLSGWWEEWIVTEDSMDFGDIVFTLRQRLEMANQIIYKQYSQNDICGTTVAALLIYGEKYSIFSSGDSRIYCLNGWHMKQMTIDDVWENLPENNRLYHGVALKRHKNYGKLAHAIGIEKDIAVNIITGTWDNGKKFLLCSDGLYKMCRNSDLKYFLKKYKGKKNGNALLSDVLRTVYKNGAKDNVSAVFVIGKE